MPDTLLHDYLSKIEGWVRSGQPDRAAIHCRHVLAFYPECIKAHKLLGEAYLDKGMLAEAQACFERTLNADPESAIAHIGLSLISDRQGMLPKAIQHMERAFDLASGNREVRAQLQALYARRGDSRSAGPALSRAAMARVYAQNGLIERAIAEFKEALRQNPELPDIHIGLAEAQWRAGHGQEAMQTCWHLLAEYPGCLKALLILGCQLPEKGPEADSESMLAKAQALDPENRLAQAMMGERSPLPFREVFVPEIETKRAVEAGVSKEGDSMDLGEEASSGAETIGSDREDLADEAAAGEQQPQDLEPETPPTPTDEDVSPHDLELPDWLQESHPLPTAERDEAAGEAAPQWIEPWDSSPAKTEQQAEDEEVGADDLEPPLWMEEQAVGTAGVEERAPEGSPMEVQEDESEVEAAAELDLAGHEAGGSSAPEVPDWVRHMEEAVARQGPAEAAEIPGRTSAAAVLAATQATMGSAAERERIGELLQLVQREPRKFWIRIELARLLSTARDWDGALLQYEELIADHKLIRAVILDLHELLKEETDRVQVYRLLGDAYMESDQIDQALEMYRLARQILRRR